MLSILMTIGRLIHSIIFLLMWAVNGCVVIIRGIKKPDAVKLYRAILLYGGAVGIEFSL